MDLKKLIYHGEGENLDFKQEISSVQKIAKTLVAFANTTGGKILIGVKDNGKILGAKVEDEKFMILGASESFCKPQVPVVFLTDNIDGRAILVVDIPESENKPHYAKGDDNKWWAYIRVKDKCLLASKVMLDVMKGDARGDVSKITFGKAEKGLLEYLEKNERITLKEFCKLSNISKWRANKILVNLVRMKVIKVLSHEKMDYYSI